MVQVGRRSLVLGGLAALLAGSAAEAQEAGGRLSRITVDVSVLEERGLGPIARLLATALRNDLQAQFAGRLGNSGAPALVVRLTTLLMPSFTGADALGGGGGMFGGGSGGVPHDYLEGEALIVGSGGGILARYPLLTNLPSSYSGPWYDPQIDRKRLLSLSAAFASWVRRRFA